MGMNTSWKGSGHWYKSLVDIKGHYYHRQVVIPKSLALLGLNPTDSLLDLACGQGVLARHIAQEIYYQGIDLAKNLIDYAVKFDKNPGHHYLVDDVTKSLNLTKTDFSHAAFILSLQNIRDPQKALLTAAKYIKTNGKLLLVLNHPCFRIPRQTSWGIDEKNKLQYRRINRYLSPLNIPITTHPGLPDKSLTWTFHYPISKYSEFLRAAGFVIETIEEWISDKKSAGKSAKMENLARNEIPLFMAIIARRK